MFKHLETIHIRHILIKNDEAWLVFFNTLQTDFAIFSLYDTALEAS